MRETLDRTTGGWHEHGTWANTRSESLAAALVPRRGDLAARPAQRRPPAERALAARRRRRGRLGPGAAARACRCAATAGAAHRGPQAQDRLLARPHPLPRHWLARR